MFMRTPGSHWWLTILAGLLLAACGAAPPPDLEQGARVVRSMLKPANLSRSSFSALYEQPKPSDLVSYLFSEMGAAEWPVAGLDDPEQMRAIGQPMPPAGVAYVPRRVDPQRGRQIVVGFDDARGVITIRGFVEPGRDAVLDQEISLPTGITPAPGVREMTESQAQMGVSHRLF